MSPAPGRAKAFFTADVLAPVVTITAPGNGATVTGAVNLTATATDIGSGVKSVQWQVDGSNYGSLKTSSPFTQSFDPTPYSLGNHTVTAIVTDNANRQSSSSITIANQMQKLKDVSYPGNSGSVIGWAAFTFNTISVDQWGNGFEDGTTFHIPAGYGGTYSLYFQVRQPGYNATGFGYGSGWSGDANGQAVIQTNRYGNHALQSWATSDTTAQNWMTCFVTGIALLAGDYVNCWTWGGATGIGVQNYDGHAQFTRTGP